MQFVDGWLDVAKEYNINGNSWDRGGVKATHLVIHGTAGGSNGNDTLDYEQSVGVSTHFAASTNGDIWQGVSCDRAAWGNAPLMNPRFNFARADINPNLWTISIEFCKPDSTNQINITDAQKASGFALIAAVCDAYGIDKRRGDGQGGIISHADINSVNRSGCPGTFPWDDLMIYLANGGQHVGIPNGWHDDGTTLTAPNGYKVVLGFRGHVLNNPWDSDNWPLENESGANPIEVGNPSLGSGTRQRFRKTTLGYTAAMGVYVMWTGQELIALSKLIGQLTQQLASTQNVNVQQLQAQLDAANAQLGAFKTALATIQAEIGAALK